MAWIHYFDEEVAKKYGVPAAIMIQHLRGRIRSNMKSGRNFRDERTWTFNSIKGWQGELSFWTIKQIRGILDDLREKKVLIVGCFNKISYDRTLWYAFEDETYWMEKEHHVEQDDLPQGADDTTPPGQLPLAPVGEPIPPSPTPSHTPDIPFGASSKDRQLYPEGFQEFWDVYPRKKEKKKAFKMWKVALRHGADDGELTKAARNYAAECDTKGRAEDYIKHPATFLGPNDHWRDYLKTEIISAEERSEKVQCQACGAKMVPAGSLCSVCRDPFDGGLARERERRRAAGTK